MMNEIYLRRRNKIFLLEGFRKNEAKNQGHIVTIFKNIENLGYTFSQDIYNVLMTYSIPELETFYLSTVKILKELKGAHVKYRPMYPNFPKQVMEASDVELFVNAIIHYWSAGTLLPGYEKETRLPLFDVKKVKVIGLGTEKDFKEIFTNLVSSKTSISDTDKTDIEWFIKTYKTAIYSMLPKEIPLKENVALISKLTWEILGGVKSEYFKTATDVLRFAVALSDGDISLAKNTKFKSYSRGVRGLILGLLSDAGNIEEDMLRYKNVWIRLGERLHPGEYSKNKRFKKAIEAFRKIRNDVKIWTFNGKVAKAFADKKGPEVLKLLKERPGDFARKLDWLLRNMNGSKTIITDFWNVADKVSTPVLLQVMEHFKQRNNGKDLRVFFPKGNVAKAYGIKNGLVPQNSSLCDLVTYICEDTLVKKFKEKDSLGKVYLDPKMKNYLVPFSQRSASKALKTIVRGSKLDIEPSTKTVRSFIYWKNGNGRTDLDLSAVMYGDNWEYKEHISYTNLRSSRYKAAHSGDIVDAPRGASEFIDIDVESAIKYGARYIVFSVNSFTEQPYCDLPECFMGWMSRENPGSGEIYEPKTVENKIDITANTKICIPMILDLVEMKMIWTDIALANHPNYYNNVEGNQKGMVLMGKAMTSLVKPNLYDLFRLNTIARGTFVETAEEADTVFSVDKGVTPFDTDVIMGKYL